MNNTDILDQARKSWDQLSTENKVAVGVAAAVEVGLVLTAWHKIYHLPARRIRGKKWVWSALTTLFGGLGSIIFLAKGVKR